MVTNSRFPNYFSLYFNIFQSSPVIHTFLSCRTIKVVFHNNLLHQVNSQMGICWIWYPRLNRLNHFKFLRSQVRTPNPNKNCWRWGPPQSWEAICRFHQWFLWPPSLKRPKHKIRPNPNKSILRSYRSVNSQNWQPYLQILEFKISLWRIRNEWIRFRKKIWWGQKSNKVKNHKSGWTKVNLIF